MEISCRITDYCIKKRLQWNSCFARKVCKESEYYEEMLRYLRKNLAVCALQKLCLIYPIEVVYQMHTALLQSIICLLPLLHFF